MIARLDYARVRTAGAKPLYSKTPRRAALLFTAFFLLGWAFFFTFGSSMAIRSHFTTHPQDFSQFHLSPWQRAQQQNSSTEFYFRQAVWPLTFHTLRFRQETDPKRSNIRTVAYHADIRWGPTIIALLATAILPFVVYFGLRRALRIQHSMR